MLDGRPQLGPLGEILEMVNGQKTRPRPTGSNKQNKNSSGPIKLFSNFDFLNVIFLR